MKELSLNLLDIAENSVKAGAKQIRIELTETDETLLFYVEDDGQGMSPEMTERAVDPFMTSRTTRCVGLGLSFLKMEAEQTGGWMTLESVSEESDPVKHGTKVTACFNKNHIDYIPLGDVVMTMQTLIQGNPEIDMIYRHRYPRGETTLDCRELRVMLDDVPLSEPEVIAWIGASMREEYAENGYELTAVL